MGEISLPVLYHFILLLGIPFIGGLIAMRMRIPAIIGYIVGGLALGVFLDQSVKTQLLSEFAGVGIVLLLFTVGLELDLNNLKRFGKFAIKGGLLQLLFSFIFIFALCLATRFSLVEALFIAASFSMSSTAVVAKIIQDRQEESSLLGSLTISILLFQDIFAIPLIIIATSLGQGLSLTGFVGMVIFGLLKAAIVLILMYVIGIKFVPFFFKKVAKTSRESLNLATILFVLICVFIFSKLGLSAVIAAFIAGFIIGQTLEHQHIFTQMRPLRDVFSVLFFVFLGASVSLSSALTQLPAIILFSLVLILIKFIVILLLFINFRFHSRTSFSIASYLSQVGEFAFLVLTAGLISKNISYQTYNFAIISTLISLAVSPYLISQKDKLYFGLKKKIKKYLPDVASYINLNIDREVAHIDAFDLTNHIIICGFGRVGLYVGRALTMAKISYIAIDYNIDIVEKAKKKGVNIIYGDPTDIDILDYAQAEDASVIITAVPELISQEMIILNAKKLNPKILVITRVEQEESQRRVRDLGAEIVVQPEFEAALSIIRRIFANYNLEKEDIIGKIKRLKIEHGMN